MSVPCPKCGRPYAWDGQRCRRTDCRYGAPPLSPPPVPEVDPTGDICQHIGHGRVSDAVACARRAASVKFTGVKGRVAELLSHPDFAHLRRVCIHTFFDLAAEDVTALRSRSTLSPIKAIWVGDGQSAQEIIELLASRPGADGVEELGLYWDAYLDERRDWIDERVAEVNRAVGRDICKVSASN